MKRRFLAYLLANFVGKEILWPLKANVVTFLMSFGENRVCLGACRSIRSGFERPFFRLTASGCIDDKTNIACFSSPRFRSGQALPEARNARSRCDDHFA